MSRSVLLCVRKIFILVSVAISTNCCLKNSFSALKFALPMLYELQTSRVDVGTQGLVKLEMPLTALPRASSLMQILLVLALSLMRLVLQARHGCRYTGNRLHRTVWLIFKPLRITDLQLLCSRIFFKYGATTGQK